MRQKRMLCWTVLLLLLFQSMALAAMPCLHANLAASSSHHCHMPLIQADANADDTADDNSTHCQKCALAVLLLADDHRILAVKLLPPVADSYQPLDSPHFYSRSQPTLPRPPQAIIF